MILVYAFIIGMIIGTITMTKTIIQEHKKTKQAEREYLYTINQPRYYEPSKPPFYVLDELQALDNQIETYKNIIDELQRKASITWNDNDKMMIYKKQADLMVKISSIEKKAYKLREQYNL